MLYRTRVRLSALLLIALLSIPVHAQPVTKELAPGVMFTQEIVTDPAAPLVVNMVSIDLANPQTGIRAAIGKDVVYMEDPTKGREVISALTARRGALIGVNADFFPFTGDPLGICIVDGELVSEAPGNRAAIAINEDKTVFFDTPAMAATLTTASGAAHTIDGINRIRETGQLIIYTEAFGASTRNTFKAVEVVCTSSELPVAIGKPVKLVVSEIKADAADTAIPKGGVVFSGGGAAGKFLTDSLKVGDTLTVQFDVKSPAGHDWSKVRQAVGGGPWLVRDGKAWIDTIAEGFNAGFASTKHPRTAVGLTADGKLVLVTVDGRQFISGGVSLADMAALMIRVGAVNAINLDGGGSTTLSVKGLIMNSPSEGAERPVADGLLVFAQEAACEVPVNLAICGLPAQVVSGQGVMLQLTGGEPAVPLTEDQLRNVVWGTTRGIGLVNQSGYFTPVKARKGTVSALYRGQTVSVEVEVRPGALDKLAAELTADKSNPLVSGLTVTATDMCGNRIPGLQVLIMVTGGKPDLDGGATDAKGEFATNVTWDSGAADRLAVAVIGDKTAQARPSK